ncbi:uncharacterized protein LOC143918898 isoform X2 [Arctopsyche grandis]|uniref:uncharacterized protein LOC143918898 isoform X2 n=1 Tax=Arctopsyche grandis TaxID=121162 RepID=UPI00406D820B
MSALFQLLSIFFLLCSAFALDNNKSTNARCGPNEKLIVRTGQEPTCSPEPFGPIHGTTPFCACTNGYVRHYGKCIKPHNCKKCKLNEIFVYCIPQPSCPSCGLACIPGCICKQGYIKDNYGNCVKMCTRPNEEFTTCIPLCPEMCRLINGIHITCPPPADGDLSCKPGCQCIKAPFLCTDPNEEYAKCGDPYLRTCATVGITNSGPPAACYPACICKTGLVKDVNNKCIDPSLC